MVAVVVSSAPAQAATFTVTNTNDDGPGSFRKALIDANQTPGLDTITFSIGSGPQVISFAPNHDLPAITDPVIVDGATQPGYSGAPLVEINGAQDIKMTGLSILAGNSTVRPDHQKVR